MSKTVYLGYYALENQNKIISPAGVTLMKYIIGVLNNNICKNLTVVSPAQSKTKEDRKMIEQDKVKYVFLRSYINKNIFMRMINYIRKRIDLYKELMRTLNDGDTLIVYHSLAYINVLKKIRKKKHVKLVLQVCEIYADVLESTKIKKREISWIEQADEYIFSSKQLESILNKNHKNFVICLGTYFCNEEIKSKSLDPNFIHVVYAGTFDPRKGGMAAAAAAKYLPENYHVHILGFGSNSEVENLNKCINELEKISKCRISYDGCLSGEEYVNFIQSCDIGLSTQDPNAQFNASSFPSKILSYMSNGLRVVSIETSEIKSSAVGNVLYYYQNQTPEEIAKTIKNIDFNDDYDGREIIRNLNLDFCLSLGLMLRDEIN